MAISGTGLASFAVGSVFLWSAIKGASVTESIRTLLMGDQPSGETVYPIHIPEKTEETGSGASSDRSGGFAAGRLDADAKRAAELIISKFGNPYGIGGYRSGAGAQDHGTGNAIDVMVSPGGKRPNLAQRTRGNAIADWARSNYKELNVKYVIWQQQIWNPSVSNSWRRMSDRGSITQNHYDHVHISFN